MLTKVRQAIEILEEATTSFDPAVVHAEDAEVLVDLFTRVERLGSSGRTLAARRAAEAQAWKRDGHHSADEWLAERTGETRGRAKRTLELGERLERHEETRERYTRGELSETQADIVAGAADDNPDAEGDLLEAAERESVKALKEEAARARAAVADEEQRQERIHQERYASGSTDEEGAYRLSGREQALRACECECSALLADARYFTRSLRQRAGAVRLCRVSIWRRSRACRTLTQDLRRAPRRRRSEGRGERSRAPPGDVEPARGRGGVAAGSHRGG